MQKLLIALISLGTLSLNAQEVKKEVHGKAVSACPHAPKYKPNYWYVGGEFFSPMFFDDLYSWNSQTFHFGKGGALKVGYQFSPLFGLELSGAIGTNKVSPNRYQYDYVLGTQDAYTYYPYTEIDGTVYSYPVTDLFGEQGKHNQKDVALEGVGFDKIVSKVSFKRLAVNASFNLTRLFTAKALYGERPVELIVRPGVYLTRFDSKVELAKDAQNLRTKETVKEGTRVAPKVNRKATLGLGGDVSVRFNLSSRWALDLTNRLVWQRDHAMDGILSAKRAYDSFVWAPAVGITYKFRKKAPACPVLPQPDPLPVPVLAVFPELFFTLPEAPQTLKPKVRDHTAMVYLTYPLNKTYIVRDLHNNPKELAKLDNEIDSFLTNKDFTVKGIRIEGFASPEGPYANNMRLAQGRAASLIDYVVQRTTLTHDRFALGRTTENWDGLKRELENNGAIAHRQQLLDVFNANPDTEERKQALKHTVGYPALLAEIYPKLRLSSYTVNYEVRSYNPEEAKEVIKKDPTKLSAEEIYSVALNYGLDTPDGVRTMEILNATYPSEDVTIAANGGRLMQQADYAQAITTLERVQAKSATVQNMLGVAYAKTGEGEKACNLFRQASVSNSDARRNLELLTKYLESNK